MIFGRKIPTNLLTRVKSPATEQQHKSTHQRQQQTEQWYNKNNKVLPDLNVDDAIYYQDVAKRTWTPGQAIRIGPEPHSYTVKCHVTGREVRKNRQLIRPRTALAPKTETLISFDITEAPQPSTQETDVNATASTSPNTGNTSSPTLHDHNASAPLAPQTLPTPSEPPNVPSPPPAPSPLANTSSYRTRSGRHSRCPQRLIEGPP